VQGSALPGAGGGFCPVRAPALDAVEALGLSTDGRYLYAVSSGNQPGEDSIVTLHRDGRSGAISPRDCVSSLGTSRCPRQVAGLRGASAIVFSPDGRFAYVASQLSSALVAFQRNRFTGALLPLPGPAACAGDPAPPLARGDKPCPTAAAGLRGARALAISRDGRLVYVAGFDPGSLTVLARDAASGALAPLAGVCMQAGPGADCRPDVAGLHGAAALALSRDGNTLYLAAQGDDAALAIPLSGGIPQLPPAPGPSTGTLGGPQALALPPDGRTLYLASAIDDEVAALRAQ
jgi:6-phosphogluconolactonase (cycloisomerase 2 family)